MFPLLLALATAAHAEDIATDLTWNWAAPHRWYLEAEAHLPSPMFFYGTTNTDVRAMAFQIRLATACSSETEAGSKSYDVTCKIEDVSLVAAAYSADAGRLQPVLDEMDAKMTGAVIQLQVRADGKISNVDLEGIERNRQRDGTIQENLRLILVRAFAGLDFQLPRSGKAAGDTWVQYGGLLFAAPSDTGNAGSVEMVHQATERRSNGIVVQTAGHGVITPGETANNYDTQMSSTAIFDPALGVLRAHNWTLVGSPTASSVGNQGIQGADYLQTGKLRLLADDEHPDVGKSEEAQGPGDPPSEALRAWAPLGAQN